MRRKRPLYYVRKKVNKRLKINDKLFLVVSHRFYYLSIESEIFLPDKKTPETERLICNIVVYFVPLG